MRVWIIAGVSMVVGYALGRLVRWWWNRDHEDDWD